jgi:Sulfotransferase family
MSSSDQAGADDHGSPQAQPGGERPLGVAPTPTADSARAEPGRLPDFFIVGHPKSGTTALYEMLRRHPQVYMSEVKEPRYFAADLPSQYRPWNAGAPAKSYEDYLGLFAAARPDQRVGEASTAYIWSTTAAQLIAEAQPSAQIIVLVREPAAYLRSLHLQLLEISTEKEPDLRRAIELESARREGRDLPDIAAGWPAVLFYREHVRYVEQLRRFHTAFPREQVLVLVYDDFRSDNEGTVRGVQRFLGIDDTVALEVLEANPSVRMRSVRADEMINAVTVGRGPVARAVKAAVKTVTPAGVRGGAQRQLRKRLLFGSPRPADEDVMLELRRSFKPEVQALSEYLGRDLVALWGYDRLG